ncbi:hypothetical protein AMC82_PB00119 (plasmid) [Rhizobium phaseoli]|uniref:hypothetical protein n=1 Tax=Rhizobium phaseoli TaxID=396 RepID=UPI00036501BC|nr:hypothetical protein [Rhizobium phaseoli]KEC71217.1 hypothetical protein RLPCCGM1_p0478 [Rhizobium leguminosarum bv. phaseoli CCGM1]ANL36809.1 hypothetical protein AMC89_PB00117 [Rhizobium phaseoli]ANL68282.1 hypothetical protein AMC84_PB00119 [Rhizobium phaseoli]ANL81093.1 hypothetical protein AMC82_PB00119 [Rhizobium phaseoli]ANM00532.1 hypothetical protein AMC79_PB00117 [Rhizobium phaseoli]
MPYNVTINVTEAFTDLTVDDGLNPYVDKNNLKLENLDAGPSIFEIEVEADNSGNAVVYVNATDSSSKFRKFTYNFPQVSDPGNIYVPKPTAASQSEVDKLAEEIKAIKQQIAGP